MKYREKLSILKEENIENVIVQAYWLFIEKGVEKTTMTDIAQKAEIAPTTLFRYFGNKKTLLIECGKQFWAETLNVNNPSLSADYQKLTGYEQCKALLYAFLPALLEYPQHLRFLRDFDVYMERHNVSPEELSSYDAVLMKWREIAKKAFAKGAEDHSLRQGIDFELFYFTATRLLLTFGEKLACEAALLPSDSMLSPKLQMETAIKMTLSYLD